MPAERLVYTAQEAADLLGVSVRKLYRLAREGAIPSLTLGGRIVVPVRGLERFLDATGEQAS